MQNVVTWAMKPGDRGFSFINNIANLGLTPEELARKLVDSPLQSANEPRLVAHCYSIEVQCENGLCRAFEVIALILRSKCGRLLRSAGIIRPLGHCPICGAAKVFQDLVKEHQRDTT